VRRRVQPERAGLQGTHHPASYLTTHDREDGLFPLLTTHRQHVRTHATLSHTLPGESFAARFPSPSLATVRLCHIAPSECRSLGAPSSGLVYGEARRVPYVAQLAQRGQRRDLLIMSQKRGFLKMLYINTRGIDGCECIVFPNKKPRSLIWSRVDEQTELSKRYLKFNLRGLIDVAVGVCEGARYCPSWTP
jgi:hypothetical protein